ncbi:MAG: relaxase/mobilization nuclease domain-containing protein [Firmicutes bacterium]|nr:relaxase/mobilization nuclease domain-containing protein [Bacillota bacterium]
MAILKHLTNKSSNYGKALEYLIYQHNEFTQKPVLDSNGNMQLREELYIDGLNCQPLTFAKECELLNAQYHKNQKADEIKSHHYIISFDPKDAENGLTGEKAQEIGLEFAQKYFAGHQALVCTHTDGHNRSGNNHVHIVINSLRKYDVERQSFMERDYDSRAGYKHHQTRQYLTAMQEGLMAICEREHLHQVDLLAPAADKVTDREYRLNQRRSQNVEIASDNSGSQSSGTKPFQSQKKYLQDAIREVASYAHSPEQFGADLKELYGIQFKISRGRFSYLHPGRQKYMTGRTLGNDYTEDYLLPLFDGNRLAGRTREEMIPSTNMNRHNKRSDPAKDSRPAYDPTYDYTADPIAVLHFRTKLRLVVDLQTYVKAQASRAYARKIKMSNLQQMAQTICFVQEHGIETRADLESLRSSAQQKLNGLQKQDPSYQELHRQVRELQVVCSNVDAILLSEPQQHHRSTEKAQSLD